ncbi:MAG: hypothetical protein Q7U99_00550 [Rubrivivax sp.]|nr:hypothetical protein [Rubrivivax sp.]
MDTLQQALRGARHSPAPLQALQPLLLLGGGGTLGSAVLAESLVAGRFLRVRVLVTELLASTVRGFEAAQMQVLQGAPADDMPAAVIIFERQRHSNGRDDAFMQPEPTDLLALARLLRQRGVQRLLVVVPHAPALLPQALSHGLASLDEAAVAALGFSHLVFLRASQSARAAAQGPRLQRFAGWWLSQLAWMVPQRQQPLRAVTLARCVVQLARLLPRLPPGTRVIAPETLWQWAQHDDGLEAELMKQLGGPP